MHMVCLPVIKYDFKVRLTGTQFSYTNTATRTCIAERLQKAYMTEIRYIKDGAICQFLHFRIGSKFMQDLQYSM